MISLDKKKQRPVSYKVALRGVWIIWIRYLATYRHRIVGQLHASGQAHENFEFDFRAPLPRGHVIGLRKTSPSLRLKAGNKCRDEN